MTDPAIVYENKSEGPGTHVLLVGIGAYDHLIDGNDMRDAVAEGMEQLVAPPLSVKAIADWFLDGNFRNDVKPLASVAMVVATDGPYVHVHAAATNGGAPVPRGTAGDVVAAIRAWLKRASTSRDNLAIFYFCGHGTFSGSPMLLCRDYGNQEFDRFDGAINFGGFRSGMEYQVPGQQILMADACRTPEAIPNALAGLPNAGHSAVTPQPLDGGLPPAARQSVHFATSHLTQSFGRTAGIGLYAEALLKALAGGGAQIEEDNWVGTSGLQNALEAYCMRLAADAGLQQEPDRTRAGRFNIHRPAKVEVPVYLTCDPGEALDSGFNIVAERDGALALAHEHDPADKPGCRCVDLLLEPDKYQVTATFAATSSFAGGTRTVLVHPPATPLLMKITRRSDD